ncbi:MAG: hypothetical protein M1816_003234 [Peltula sp. TS41687]|nr:MAG: hypothetical protein M1816_003234 [Peltula sp. TS41687]
MASAAIDLAETLQSASIKPHPSAAHDINPSTAADVKIPLTKTTSSEIDEDEEEIPESVLHLEPRRRKSTLPPLPDLRFEQSYLASIKGAESTGRVVWITIRDQVCLPLLQGTLWTLALQGWRHWNRSANYSGRSVGSRIRRWWYGVNNWKIPGAGDDGGGTVGGNATATQAEKQLATDVETASATRRRINDPLDVSPEPVGFSYEGFGELRLSLKNNAHQRIAKLATLDQGIHILDEERFHKKRLGTFVPSFLPSLPDTLNSRHSSQDLFSGCSGLSHNQSTVVVVTTLL